MPIFESSRHGDLFVEYNVVLPTEMSQKTRRSKFLDPSSLIVLQIYLILELVDAFLEGTSHDEL